MVSIIIPYYNNQSTIVETLNSVYHQTYSNLEVILIDDGSKIDIEPTIYDYIINKGLIFLKQENKGVSFARNYGASIAKGQFLLFLDSDDIIDKKYIEKCVEAYQNNPNLKIVYANAAIFGRENKIWDLENYTTFKNLLIGNTIYISALLKKEDFENAGGFDTTLDFYEDWDLWISILKNNGEVYKIPETLFYYRKNESNESASDYASLNKSVHAKNRLKIYIKHYDLYEKEFTHFEEIFLTYVESKKIKKNKWFEKLLKFK